MHRSFEKEQDRLYKHVKARGECDSFSVTHVRLPTFTAAPLFELSTYERAVSLLQGQEVSELAMTFVFPTRRCLENKFSHRNYYTLRGMQTI